MRDAINFKKVVNNNLVLLLFYNWKNYAISKFDIIYLVILGIWVFEWAFIIEFLFGEWYSTYVVFPMSVPFLLAGAALYWFFLWSMSVWRRSQFGRFTRGERTLWAKAYTAFWVAELVTLLSFVLIYLWLSWGPLPMVPSVFMVPSRGLMLEFMVYSYLMFMTYVAKFNISWNLWNFQLIIAMLSMIILSYLLWSDVLVLATRDSLLNNYGARWRNMKLNALVYSLSHEWWVTHMLGRRSVNFKFTNLLVSLKSAQHPFKNFVLLTEYENNAWLSVMSQDASASKLCLGLNTIFNIDQYYEQMNNSIFDTRFYPKSIGFIGKRIAMWDFLTFLKMWHQLLILLWWVLYIFSLNSAKTASYPVMAACYFSIYCCFIIAITLYLVNWMTTLESMLSFSPGVFSLIRFSMMFEKSIFYFVRGLFSFEQYTPEMAALQLYKF